ncbi:hypothetical protein D0Z08_15025 [Nocardioides immobilis]|uniref:Uncharacterized protein n=1 Tax=Nocardioides immobilis TaxID=2049295 RepID=A0A417Y0Z5_9ACTN|nr:hypothetical protein [Nocardioides immobilis]RHW26275.1 hypothetical protein D0Z08_15025 [Nocardioides immobilis]
MGWVSTWHHELGRFTVAAARTTQAAAIGALDRALGSPGSLVGRASRLRHLQLDLLERIVDPAEVMEETYETVERLVALHHEFARRVVEVVDTRDDASPLSVDRERLASVSYLSTAPVRG